MDALRRAQDPLAGGVLLVVRSGGLAGLEELFCSWTLVFENWVN